METKDILRVLAVRLKACNSLREQYELSSLEIVLLCYVETRTLGCSRRSIVDAQLGSERNVQAGIARLAMLGYVQLYQQAYRAARQVRLTDKGRECVTALSRQIRRTVRELERGG